MNTIASITPTPAFASINLTAGLRLAPGFGLALAALMSVALWAGLARIVIALVA